MSKRSKLEMNSPKIPSRASSLQFGSKNSNTSTFEKQNQFSKFSTTSAKVLPVPEPNYAQEMIIYFYTELMNYVIEENLGVPPDAYPDTDEEPTYDKNKITNDSLLNVKRSHSQSYKKKEKVIVAVSSKLMGKLSQLPNPEDLGERMEKLDRKLANQQTNSTIMWNNTQTDFNGNSKGTRSASKMKSLSTKDQDYFQSVPGFREVELKRYTSNYESVLTSTTHAKDDELVGWMVKSNMHREHVQIKFITGAIYRGDMLRHQFDGKGEYRWPDGTAYEGEFAEGNITGIGKLTYTNMTYYRGKLINCILEGNGTYAPFSESTQYSGEWSGGVPHGQGRLNYQYNDYYDGSWSLGKKNGHGIRRYPSGSIYSGNWLDGRQSGEGSMLFFNRDFYQGEWYNGLPDGYGEYTWGTQLNKGLTFTMEKQYYGSFMDGKRDGYGIQIFGMEGSKIASLFAGNTKSGAGIIVCGDGTTIERKPMFLMDNPAQRRASFSTGFHQFQQFKPPASHHSRGLSVFKIKSLGSMNLAIKEAFPDGAATLDHESKVNKTFPMADNMWLPIAIPMHATPLDINLTYHVKKLTENFHTTDINQHVNSLTIIQANSSQLRKDSTLAYPTSIDDESRLLSRSIAYHYVYLKELYNKYSTLNVLEKCCADHRKPVMNRLHLWQFLRDMAIYNFNISLYDVDMMMLDIPGIHLETEHDPFECIYFWQFLHCLLALCFKMFINQEFYEKTKATGTYQALFYKFINDISKPNEGKFNSKCLFTYPDLLPIKSVHGLYKTVGEPHTARTLLNRICNRTGEEPLSCRIRRRMVYSSSESHGHYVINGSTFLFLKHDHKDPWMHVEPKKLNKYADDPFYTDLRVFRTLGPKNVVNSICNICPNIAENGDIVNIDYQITFLEFYEILFDLADELRKLKKETELIEGARASQVQEVFKRVSKKSNGTKEDIRASSVSNAVKKKKRKEEPK